MNTDPVTYNYKYSDSTADNTIYYNYYPNPYQNPSPYVVKDSTKTWIIPDVTTTTTIEPNEKDASFYLDQILNRLDLLSKEDERKLFMILLERVDEFIHTTY